MLRGNRHGKGRPGTFKPVERHSSQSGRARVEPGGAGTGSYGRTAGPGSRLPPLLSPGSDVALPETRQGQHLPESMARRSHTSRRLTPSHSPLQRPAAPTLLPPAARKNRADLPEPPHIGRQQIPLIRTAGLKFHRGILTPHYRPLQDTVFTQTLQPQGGQQAAFCFLPFGSPAGGNQPRKTPSNKAVDGGFNALPAHRTQADVERPDQQDNQSHAQIHILVPLWLCSGPASGTVPRNHHAVPPLRLNCHRPPPLRV